MAKDGKQESLDRFLTQTPKNNNKRWDPFSPDNISPSLLQVQKQARLNFVQPHLNTLVDLHPTHWNNPNKLTNKTQLFRHYKTSWTKSRKGLKNGNNTVDEQVWDSTMSEFQLTVMVTLSYPLVLTLLSSKSVKISLVLSSILMT
jgi:hypothetical protein